jgi:hypothetical protein
MQLTLPYLIGFVRGLDERLTDLKKYSDDVLADRIRDAIYNLSALVQPFVKEELIDLNQYFDLGLKQFELDMQENILGYLETTLVVMNGFEYEDISTHDIIITEQLDKSLHVKMSNIPSNQMYLRARYFYVLNIEKTPLLEVEPEIWTFIQHSIQIVIWGMLKDYDKEQYHTKVLDQYISRKITQSPVQNTIYPMKGGFI